ncbi:hypothetical protein DL96DRAFT_1638097 [Flagelloscypha sp. PMI_526]|nr:hypothetical protein DL96DRAFT_1638097 [Flagelloscypha sp. PMI_526]
MVLPKPFQPLFPSPPSSSTLFFSVLFLLFSFFHEMPSPRRALPTPPSGLVQSPLLPLMVTTRPGSYPIPQSMNFQRDYRSKRKASPHQSSPSPRKLPPSPQGLAPAPRHHRSNSRGYNNNNNYRREQQRPQGHVLPNPHHAPKYHNSNPTFDPFRGENNYRMDSAPAPAIAPLHPSQKYNQRRASLEHPQLHIINLPLLHGSEFSDSEIETEVIDISNEPTMTFTAPPVAPTPPPVPAPIVEVEQSQPKRFLTPEDVWPRLLAMVLLEKGCAGRSRRSPRSLGYVPSSLSQVVFLADD